MKIAILGYSGCGKSTLAAALGKKYGLPVLYLDQVHFLPGWQVRPMAEKLAMVRCFMENNPDWVIDGNFTNLDQPQRLAAADRILILQFAALPCLWRVIKRRVQYHHRARPSIAEGCNERISLEFLLWVLYKGRRPKQRAHYQAICSQYPGKVTVLRSPRELAAFYREQGLT